jgi:hypothetical protein
MPKYYPGLRDILPGQDHIKVIIFLLENDECSNNERIWLDEMHTLKMVVKFCTKLSFTVFLKNVLFYF